MKSLPRALIALAVLVPLWSVAAETKSSSSSADTEAAKPSVAGNFSGTWQSSGESGGKLRLKLTPDGAGWAGEASFTFEDAEIAATVKSVKVNDRKIELIVAWVIQNAPGETTLTGELTGDKLQGAYETKSSGDPSRGTWTVTRIVAKP